jgi:hypothetical protein
MWTVVLLIAMLWLLCLVELHRWLTSDEPEQKQGPSSVGSHHAQTTKA